MPLHQRVIAPCRDPYRRQREANETVTLPAGQNWARLLIEGGEMGVRIHAFDWSKTSLGRIDEWPQSLLDAVNLCVRSRFQMAIYWGPQLILLYNDAERDILGAMHPRVLGRPAAEVLADSWDIVGPKLNNVLSTGEATWSEDEALLFNRNGFLDEGFFTYSYSPIFEGDDVGGVLLVTCETTQRVLAERRLGTLRELAAETAKARTVDEVAVSTSIVLAGNRKDLPFTLLFLTGPDGYTRLCASTGVDGSPDPAFWPLQEAAITRSAQLVKGTAPRLPGCRAVLPRAAVVLPITRANKETIAGYLVAGISDFQPLDEPYRGFLELVAGQTGSALAGARVLEKQRHRAENRVKKRTHELSRAYLRLRRQIAISKKMAKTRKELLGRLVRVQEEEHRRIARELHDDLTQELAVLAIDAGTLEQQSDCPKEIALRVRRMRERLAVLSENIHALSRQLHPSILDDLGLVAALRLECHGLEQRDKIKVTFDASDIPTDLPRDVSLCVYRVTQEALRNVARHARCSRASVRLAACDHVLILCVRDRGIGFDLTSRGKIGLGLESMRERVRLINARLKIQSRQGEGTTITMRVPLHRSPE